MDLHGKIMNIHIESAKIGGAVESAMKLDNDWESRLALAYNFGHSDARHVAAELAALPPEPWTCETCDHQYDGTCEDGRHPCDRWTPRSPQSADVETVRESLGKVTIWISSIICQCEAGDREIPDHICDRCVILDQLKRAFAALDRIVGKEG